MPRKRKIQYSCEIAQKLYEDGHEHLAHAFATCDLFTSDDHSVFTPMMAMQVHRCWFADRMKRDRDTVDLNLLCNALNMLIAMFDFYGDGDNSDLACEWFDMCWKEISTEPYEAVH